MYFMTSLLPFIIGSPFSAALPVEGFIMPIFNTCPGWALGAQAPAKGITAITSARHKIAITTNDFLVKTLTS
jgi:hypothetical protein